MPGQDHPPAGLRVRPLRVPLHPHVGRGVAFTGGRQAAHLLRKRGAIKKKRFRFFRRGCEVKPNRRVTEIRSNDHRRRRPKPVKPPRRKGLDRTRRSTIPEASQNLTQVSKQNPVGFVHWVYRNGLSARPPQPTGGSRPAAYSA